MFRYLHEKTARREIPTIKIRPGLGWQCGQRHCHLLSARGMGIPILPIFSQSGCCWNELGCGYLRVFLFALGTLLRPASEAPLCGPGGLREKV